MTDPVVLLLDRLEGVRPSGSGWVARCPGHEDRHASLSVAAGDDGRALATCHAGCTIEDVVGALGLTMGDLYPRKNGATGTPQPARGRGRETRYRAHVADGGHADERIEHVRLDRPDGSKRMWWERDGHKGLGGLSPSAFALYGIERVNSETTDRVVLVEGEKATDALRGMGIAAVGTVTGAAATPCRDSLLPLAGRHVILWPDADEAGLGHMRAIAAGLGEIASSVSWVTPPAGVEPGWDAADAEPEQARRLIEGASSGEDAGSSTAEVVLLPAPVAPMAVARRLVADRFTDADGLTVIRAWRGGQRDRDHRHRTVCSPRRGRGDPARSAPVGERDRAGPRHPGHSETPRHPKVTGRVLLGQPGL